MNIELPELKYCSECERMDMVVGDFHIVEIGYDWLNCFGPFYFSAPPELEEDWELNVSIPSPAELVEMDAVASELLTEFSLV